LPFEIKIYEILANQEITDKQKVKIEDAAQLEIQLSTNTTN